MRDTTAQAEKRTNVIVAKPGRIAACVSCRRPSNPIKAPSSSVISRPTFPPGTAKCMTALYESTAAIQTPAAELFWPVSAAGPTADVGMAETK